MRGMAMRIRCRGLSRPGWREIAGTLGQLQAGRQAGNGMACSRAKARLNWVSQGQRRGRCKVRRRAERVIRPTRAKTRRLRVLVMHDPLAHDQSALVQRARLCAITCTASQAPLAAKRPEGRWFSPTPYLRSRMAFSTSAVAAMIGLQFQRLPIAVGDEGEIAVSGEEGELGTGRRLHPPGNEPLPALASGLVWNGV